MESWFSLKWFSPDTLRSFTWENSLYLYALWLLPVFFAGRFLYRKYFSRKLPVALVKRDIHQTPVAWLRFIPELLLSITTALLIIALARPQIANEKVEQWTEGIDIMIAMDVSQSMEIEL